MSVETAIEVAPPEPPAARPASNRAWTGWLRYVLSKLGGALVSLLAVVFSGFFLFRILPGDPVRALTRDRPVSPEQLEDLRRQYGLDKPLAAQFGDYLLRVFRGDLGESYQYNRPVTELIGDDLWATVLLVGTATLVAAAIGLRLGITGAWHRGGLGDRLNTGIALTLWSVPTFWLGLILITLVPFFPTGGMHSAGVEGFFPSMFDTLHHLVLPCVTLVAVIYAQYLLIMRAALLDEMGSDYLVTARAKGLRDAVVRRRHAVPNALLPTVTLIFLNLGGVVSGAILVETVFSWPGLGSLFYEALTVPDAPLLEGLFIFFAAAVIAMNLVADLLYPILDPRVRPR